MNFTFKTIAIIHSCYKEKFAIPRQAGLVLDASAQIEFLPPYNHPDMVRGLDGFSHIWISFIFNQHLDKGFNNLVSPPRLNGSQEYGIYATRSPYRPNPIGLSVVELEAIEYKAESLLLHVKGADLLDQTPIIDIKPYVTYADCITNTRNGFIAKIKEINFNITFSSLANNQIGEAEKILPEIKVFIKQLLSQDPRPHYTKTIKTNYSTKIYNYDLHWNIHGKEIEVLSLDKLY